MDNVSNVSNMSMVSRDDQFSTIEIYRFEDSNMQGLFSNRIYGQQKVFKNLIVLIMMIEDCMNSISFPQPMARYRNMNNDANAELQKAGLRDRTEFAIPREELPAEWEDAQPVATFRTRIVFRTISGWQGDAECLESGDMIQFKSDLELITFMVRETEAMQSARSR